MHPKRRRYETGLAELTQIAERAPDLEAPDIAAVEQVVSIAAEITAAHRRCRELEGGVWDFEHEHGLSVHGLRAAYMLFQLPSSFVNDREPSIPFERWLSD
jgi:hypothetical protein